MGRCRQRGGPLGPPRAKESTEMMKPANTVKSKQTEGHKDREETTMTNTLTQDHARG
jgi:hypothetical protein